MRKHLYIFVLCTLSLYTLVGCKNDKNKEPETFVSNVARPTWTISADYDFTSSMTAVVKVDLAAQYPDKAADFILDSNDLLAAFSGNTCLGIASPQDGLFFLYIVSPSSDTSSSLTDTPSSITLKYYSACYKNLFETIDTFEFKNDDIIGSVSNPFVPSWIVSEE